MKNKKNGLLVFVLKTASGDSTANGLSSRHDKLLLVSSDDCVKGPFSTKDEEDYLVLVKRQLFGEEYLSAVPKSVLDSGKTYMFGGNYITTSDSRFPNKYPIPVHDRVES